VAVLFVNADVAVLTLTVALPANVIVVAVSNVRVGLMIAPLVFTCVFRTDKLFKSKAAFVPLTVTEPEPNGPLDTLTEGAPARTVPFNTIVPPE